MIKILVVTHGPLAEGIFESTKMFFGDVEKKMSSLGLYPSDNPEDLKDKIVDKIKEIDEGEGVFVFVDMYAGTPFNMTALSIDELKDSYQLECYTGVNLPLLMETLSSCEFMNLKELSNHVEAVAADTIVNLRKSLEI